MALNLSLQLHDNLSVNISYEAKSLFGSNSSGVFFNETMTDTEGQEIQSREERKMRRLEKEDEFDIEDALAMNTNVFSLFRTVRTL